MIIKVVFLKGFSKRGVVVVVVFVLFLSLHLPRTVVKAKRTDNDIVDIANKGSGLSIPHVG